jgi:hypothetical protein
VEFLGNLTPNLLFLSCAKALEALTRPQERLSLSLIALARINLQERTMSKMPPVPPEQRSNKGPGSDPKVEVEERIPGRENFDTQGRHGNIKQNTTNQGYQQDR